MLALSTMGGRLSILGDHFSDMGGVRGGEHGQIRLRAGTADISDFEPDKLGSLPESSRTNPTPSKLNIIQSGVDGNNISLLFLQKNKIKL